MSHSDFTALSGEHRRAAADLGGPEHESDPLQPPTLLPARVHAGGEDAVARRGRKINDDDLRKLTVAKF